MKLFVIALFMFLLNSTSSMASDFSRLYDKNTLEYGGNQYSRTTNRILDEVIWPALLSNEKRNLDRKPVIKFPIADDAARYYPLQY